MKSILHSQGQMRPLIITEPKQIVIENLKNENHSKLLVV